MWDQTIISGKTCGFGIGWSIKSTFWTSRTRRVKKKILSLIFGRRIRIRRENLKKVKGKKVSDVKRFEKSAKIDIFRLFRPSFFFGIKFWAILG